MKLPERIAHNHIAMTEAPVPNQKAQNHYSGTLSHMELFELEPKALR